jgi:hydrogenase maturation protein HypF
VINDTAACIDAQAEESTLAEFLRDIVNIPPPLSHIYSIEKTDLEPGHGSGFAIGKSADARERMVFYPPDLALCADCLREFNDPGDRRHHYHFITCINCGPRFSIVTDIPYDRANTSMAPFALCPVCDAEYRDSANRRFHTQPTACAACGPRMALRDREGNLVTDSADDVARQTLALLRQGGIGAIKGVGGYHLAADALNEQAVALLRARKKRPFKPLALMAGSVEALREFVSVTAAEEALLVSPQRPIVLLKETRRCVAANVAPGITWHGVMLPYAPFHYHLFSLDPELVLVMTSGNLSEEPIAYDDADARARLARFADFFVTYDRAIIAQNDDSVLFVEMNRPFFVRRSRGYVPVPFASRTTPKHILALGGDLKNAFALARRDFVIMSQHLGDMADALSHQAFKKTVRHFISIFDAAPDVVVSDLHPGYHTTAFARELAGQSLPLIMVQHHHAHIASVLEDHGLDGPVCGIAFDGTGYGTDGALWGSEFLVAGRGSFERAGHFSEFRLPGGESAIRDVWKIGLSLLYGAYGRDYPVMEQDAASTCCWTRWTGASTRPLTCSIGRIFDGVAAILGISRAVSSEAEAAMLLEEAAARGRALDQGQVIAHDSSRGSVVSTDALTRRIVDFLKSGAIVDDIAATFHRDLIVTAAALAETICRERGLDTVALSGGVFHNRILLRGLCELLEQKGLRVLVPRKVPVNDGCIALGQVAVARALLEQES